MHGNARLLNIIFTHIKAGKIFTELSFFYIAHRKRTLSVSEITIYFMRYVFIGSKCPNVSGVSREEPTHYTIKLMFNKIHLWRLSIVLALLYFQGMACYRSATLLEVMDTSRSFWNMFVFSRVIYRRSCISEIHSNNSFFSMNKKVGGDSSSRTHAV